MAYVRREETKIAKQKNGGASVDAVSFRMEDGQIDLKADAKLGKWGIDSVLWKAEAH